jgi:hypothetical protein
VQVAREVLCERMGFRLHFSTQTNPVTNLWMRERQVQEGTFSADTFAAVGYADYTFLNGKSVDKTLAETALEYLDGAIYDVRSTDYKKHMFRVGIARALRDLVEKKR